MISIVSSQLSLFQLAATSRYPTISHSSSASPWQQSFPSQLHPSSLALAHQLSHVVRYPPPYPHIQRHTHTHAQTYIPVRTFADITTPWHQPLKATNLLMNFKPTTKKKKPPPFSGLVYVHLCTRLNIQT